MGLLDFFSKKENLAGVSVLVVDDGAIDRKTSSAILSKKGYTVYQAESGTEGLEKAKSVKPDLILLDFDMPDLKGPDVCEQLKSDDETKEIPVIFLTSMDTPQSVLDCFEKGAEIFLPKPIQPSELLEQVHLTLKENSVV